MCITREATSESKPENPFKQAKRSSIHNSSLPDLRNCVLKVGSQPNQYFFKSQGDPGQLGSVREEASSSFREASCGLSKII